MPALVGNTEGRVSREKVLILENRHIKASTEVGGIRVIEDDKSLAADLRHKETSLSAIIGL